MTAGFAPTLFDAPLVNPSPAGLYAVTQWQDSAEGEPLRFLAGGVQIRVFNYGSEDSFGVWSPDWDAAEADLTAGDVKQADVRPDSLDTFVAQTTWAADECDLTAPSQAEVKTRAQQVHRLREPIAVERTFAERMLADAGTPDTTSDIVGAVAHVEAKFAVANTTGYVHASPIWAASAAQANLLRYSGGKLTTPLGHTWVFGGGYVGPEGLADKLVATSPTFGWRGQSELRTAQDVQRNRFVAIVERSVLVGVEHVVGAVNVTG